MEKHITVHYLVESQEAPWQQRSSALATNDHPRNHISMLKTHKQLLGNTLKITQKSLATV